MISLNKYKQLTQALLRVWSLQPSDEHIVVQLHATWPAHMTNGHNEPITASHLQYCDIIDGITRICECTALNNAAYYPPYQTPTKELFTVHNATHRSQWYPECKTTVIMEICEWNMTVQLAIEEPMYCFRHGGLNMSIVGLSYIIGFNCFNTCKTKLQCPKHLKIFFFS